MSLADNQARTFLRLLAELQPHWRRDAALPARIQTLLARHREFGARDRRLYRELIYTTLRYLPWIEPCLERDAAEAVRRVAWLAAETPATRAFRATLATGEAPTGDNAELLPGWFRAHCPELFSSTELEMQLRRAPVWLRLQTEQPQRVFEEFAAREWEWRPSGVLPDAIQLLTEADATKTQAWQNGWFEVQDLGSQMLLETIGLEPGERWLDACAGAGGKTLQLARLLGPAGHVHAHDVRAGALLELTQRARRAGIDCHLLDDTSTEGLGRGADECHLIDDTRPVRIMASVARPTGSFDGVLVDAPCSGSGTWRRAPHLKWITTEEHIARAAEKQLTLLSAFAAHVKPGGRLVYATCSVSSRENEAVVARFLETHDAFRAEPFARTFGAAPRGAGLLIFPAKHDTDGFFVASLRRG